MLLSCGFFCLFWVFGVFLGGVMGGVGGFVCGVVFWGGGCCSFFTLSLFVSGDNCCIG